jgi:hypothetical protein
MKSKADRAIKVVIVCMLLCSTIALYGDTPWLHTDGNKIKDPVGNVVVLRGVDLIDLGFLESWQGGAISMINRLTNKSDTQGSSPGWYTKVIRINITPADAAPTWPNRFNPGNDYFYNNLLRPVVDYCRTKDMYAIIDWHYVANTYDHVATTSAFWEYMAPRFAGDSHVIFELFNEPINTSAGSETNNWLSVRTDMQTWIDIVRTYAPNNLILVAGPSWSQAIGPSAAYPLTGDNIVIVSHIYPGHWLSGSQSWYTGHINTALTHYPVFMSEWGFSIDAVYDLLNGGTITNYGQPLMDFDEARKISNSAWVASYDWEPPMFYSDWTLRVGEAQMGGFVKDRLYVLRDANQPEDIIMEDPNAPTPNPSTWAKKPYATGGASVGMDATVATDVSGVEYYFTCVSGGGHDSGWQSSTHYEDTGLTAGTAYTYTVKTHDLSTYQNETEESVPAFAIPENTDIPITVVNYSFEQPGTVKIKGWNGDGTPAVDIPGWASTGLATDSGVEAGWGPTQGLWTGFIMGSDPSVWNLTNHIIASGEIFDMKVDAKNNANATSLRASLYYDNSGSRVTVATKDLTLSGSMQTFTVSFAAKSDPTSVGEKIGIELDNVSSGWVGMDNVRLMYTKVVEDMDYLRVFVDFWLADDCDETAALDLNDDCIINFYEYAFFAQNWLEEF